MTLLTYQIFKTVADMGSFHKAADVLGLTPSAISHSISSMENELGFTVLTRNKSGVSLTSYGEHLLPYVNAVLNCNESLQQVVDEFKGLKRGHVKVGCFASVCSNWMPDIITEFGEKYPAITVEVYQGTYDDVSYWIRNGIVDFGFLSRSSAGDLFIEPFYDDPLLCVAPKGFEREYKQKTITPEELSKLRLVVQPKTTDADVQRYLRENHLEINSDYHIVDDFSMLKFVAKGIGVCVIPELTGRQIDLPVDRYPVEPKASRVIGLAVLNPKFMAPAVRTLYRFIIDRYRNIPEESEKTS